MKKIISFLILGFLSSMALADNANSIKDKLEKMYPSTEISNVKNTEINGIYEVTMGNNIAYVGKDVRYFIFGTLFDMKMHQDLTALRKDELNKIDFNKLPLDNAIKIVKGKGKRVFAMFSDPDCPFCKRIEETLSIMDNYTLYLFMYPIESLHPKAVKLSENIWCAGKNENRLHAWKNYMLNNISPKSQNCKNPIAFNMKLGADLGVDGTPILFNSKGKKLAGALPKEQLEEFINE